MQVHVETLFRCDSSGRMVAVNEPGGRPAPRVFIGRTAGGTRCWFRHDLDAALVARLESLCRTLAADSEWAGPGADAGRIDATPFIDLLTRHQPVASVWAGPAFCFPSDLPFADPTVRVTTDQVSLLSPYLEDWVGDVSPDVPMCAVLMEGAAVSVCCSVRLGERAHEAGVATHPAFRGRRLAQRAVSAWAKAVRASGLVPLYSTSWENRASQAVARRLGLVQFGVDLHLT